MANHHHVLIIDDDTEMRSMVADFLKSDGYDVTEMNSATETFEKIQSGAIPTDAKPEAGVPIDLIITDLNMPGLNGIQFTEKFHPLFPNIPVILITAFGSIETAIEAIRKGAFDYTTKPFKLNEMSVTVARALRFRDLHIENRRLQREVDENYSFADIIGKSAGMREVFDLIKRVAPANANVLISGESGTGKERVARAIHDQGPRRSKKFVAINCTAIPESLLESELFGHAKGSFTGAIGRKKGLFEEADGGTIFLDEIGDMNLALQAKLLRVIQERKIRAVGDTADKEIDVRIVTATHKNLRESIRNRTFREDLYYRLAVIPIVIPPLRHRREDIPLLAEHFLAKYAAENHSPVKGFTRDALAKLLSLPFEGNVRELENLVERTVVLSRGEFIDANDFPGAGSPSAPEAGCHLSADIESFFAANQSGGLPTLTDIEKRYILFVLDRTGGKKEKAAQILGCNRRTLYRKEREYGFNDVSDESNSAEETEEEMEDEMEDEI